METALHDAVESGDLTRVRHVLARLGGKFVNARNITKETPLHIAASLGIADIVKLLLRAGADVRMRISSHATESQRPSLLVPANALEIAAAFGHASVIKVLRSWKFYSETENRAIEFAARYGHLEALKVLCFPWASIEGRALCFALLHGHVECARFIISKFIEYKEKSRIHAPVVFESDEYTSQPLKYAISSYKSVSGVVVKKKAEVILELMELFVQAGANINAIVEILNCYGRSRRCLRMCILSFAACQGEQEAASYLLANGADIHAKDNHRWGALHYAVASGKPKIVEFFLKAGAANQVNWDICTVLGNETLHLTALDIIGMLDNRLLDSGDEMLVSELVSDYKDIIRLLVDHGADLEGKDESGNTPLHGASLIADINRPAGVAKSKFEDGEVVANMPLHRMVPLVSALLAAGANPKALNKKLSTPLHMLLMHVMVAIESLSGYNDFVLNPNTNFDWRATRSKASTRELFSAVCTIIHLLVEAGADVNQRNLDGQTPLHSLVQGMLDYFRKKNNSYYRGIVQHNLAAGNALHGLPFRPQHELDPVVGQLIKAGAHSWEVVPNPCLGLPSILFDVWKRGSGTELRYLYYKLNRHVKSRLLMSLRVLNRCLPGQTEVHMQILAAAL